MYGAERGKLAARKHDGGFVHHRQKLEVAIRKELEAVQGNDFLIQLFADRNTAVLAFLTNVIRYFVT
jgi:hypothetical protein